MSTNQFWVGTRVLIMGRMTGLIAGALFGGETMICTVRLGRPMIRTGVQRHFYERLHTARRMQVDFPAHSPN